MLTLPNFNPTFNLTKSNSIGFSAEKTGLQIFTFPNIFYDTACIILPRFRRRWGHVHLCQVTLCDPIWQVALRSSMMGSHEELCEPLPVTTCLYTSRQHVLKQVIVSLSRVNSKAVSQLWVKNYSKYHIVRNYAHNEYFC